MTVFTHLHNIKSQTVKIQKEDKRLLLWAVTCRAHTQILYQVCFAEKQKKCRHSELMFPSKISLRTAQVFERQTPLCSFQNLLIYSAISHAKYLVKSIVVERCSNKKQDIIINHLQFVRIWTDPGQWINFCVYWRHDSPHTMRRSHRGWDFTDIVFRYKQRNIITNIKWNCSTLSPTELPIMMFLMASGVHYVTVSVLTLCRLSAVAPPCILIDVNPSLHVCSMIYGYNNPKRGLS